MMSRRFAVPIVMILAISTINKRLGSPCGKSGLFVCSPLAQGGLPLDAEKDVKYMHDKPRGCADDAEGVL